MVYICCFDCSKKNLVSSQKWPIQNIFVPSVKSPCVLWPCFYRLRILLGATINALIWSDSTNFIVIATNYGRPMKFSLKSRTFVFLALADELGRYILGHMGYFRLNYQHPLYFGTVNPLFMFTLIQPIFLQKTKPLLPHSKYLYGI